ncbi:GAF domain-containing sensor histidine kinase [Paenibacillus psychroresistens]|uniref:GAF domain-containing sensor histidine kinase n=1 Tax=Paenibacillus psychroresistens TaxID=1778678 RepID=UPI001D038405|nr:ATP-binding protein [Paenibacillus psychroresistens]
MYESAANVMDTASKMMPANTFCIANLDNLSTTVLKAYNRSKVMLGEGLVVDNKDSYCALVTEHAQGPLIIDNNMTHALTKDMAATQFVGGCSFLGVPIITGDGEMYGSLCAFDHEFYQYQPRDVELLLSLSAFFSTLLELETNIQQLRSAENVASKMLAEKSKLLEVLSHEVRNPMNGVLGMASLLHSTDLTNEQKEYVDVIIKSGSSLLSIMDHILDYSKIEADTLELESSPFLIRDDVNYVLQTFTEESERKDLRLYAEFESGADTILIGDSNKIRQILSNLIGNSLKFTEQGEIGVAVRMRLADGDTVDLTIEVKDTGVGIPKDQKDHLFRAFSQIHDVDTSVKYGGAGLGLAICKRLAEQMGGKVWMVDSSDEGSRFAFQIPLKQLLSSLG